MIVPILLLALVLRLVLLNQSLWLDEAISVLSAKSLGFWHFTTGYPMGDFHPPGYFALLWVWGRIFGFSEVAVRMPSVILGVLTVGLTYLLGKDLFSKKMGLLAALLLALGPLHIYYSQEARMYSLAVFAVTLSFYFLNKVLNNNYKFIVFYILSIILVFYSDYVAYFALLSQFLFVLVFFRSKLKVISLSFIGGFLGILPWVMVFPQQLAGGRENAEQVAGWAKVVGGANFKNLVLVFIKTVVGRVSFSNKIVYAGVLIPLLIFFGVVGEKGLKKIDKETKLLLCWIFIPLSAAFFVSFYIPVLAYFRIVFILPGIYLLLARGLNSLQGKIFKLALGVFILVSLTFLGMYCANPKFQREDWKSLVEYLNQKNSQEGLVLFKNTTIPAPYLYYDQQEITVQNALAKFPAENPKDIVNLNSVLQGKNKVYLVNYLVEISDPNRLVEQELVKLNFKLDSVYDIPSLGFVYGYSR